MEMVPLILLVEDNDHDVLFVQRALESSNFAYQLEVVRDGEAALEYLLRSGKYETREPGRNPGLVLLDLKLPKLSGLEVLKAIKWNLQLMNIPVVIFTVSNDDPSIRDAYDLGANSYICKSVDVARFIEDVQLTVRYWLLLNTPSQATDDVNKKIRNFKP